MSQLAAANAQIADLKAVNQAQGEDIKSLREENRYLKMKLFGPKSEKSPPPEGQQQLFDIDEDEEQAEGNDKPNSNGEDKPATRGERKRNVGRKPLPAHLPRVEKRIDLDPEEKSCCGKEMTCIGEDAREVLECIPAIFYVIRFLIPKYVCTKCGGEKGCHGAVATADLPPRVLPGSSAGNSVVAEVVANKVADGLPGYRQGKRFERFGLTISRRTITNWLLSIGKKCHVMDKLLLETALASGVIQMDETYFQVLDEEGRNNRTKSFMWVIRSVPPHHRVIYYVYHPSRASAVPRALLSGYRGFVQTDGYKGYDFLEPLEHVTLVACWAHVRRKFREALKLSGNGKGRPKKKFYAEGILARIGELYAIEKRAREEGLSPEALESTRAHEAWPILTALKASLEDHVSQFPEQSLIGKAIRYTLRLWPRLTRYADSGLVAIDNNGVENVIRPFVIGRKNWLFAGSPRGAGATATLYSLVETAKANGWEPYAYLRFLFDHLPNAIGEEELRKLLPNVAQPIPTAFYVGEDRMRFQESIPEASASIA